MQQNENINEEENLESQLEQLHLETNSIPSTYLRERTVFIEYKYLHRNVPGGVYVIPSRTSLFNWIGVIFVRSGYYQDAIFKFELTFGENYPSEIAQLRFISPVFHPLIGIDGSIKIPKNYFQQISSRIFSWHIIKYAKYLLYNRIRTGYILNHEAADLTKKNKIEFINRVKQCIDKSIEDMYKLPYDCQFQFSLASPEHNLLFEKLAINQ
eukprot:TRINITY_DN209_c0_g3_i9.p1 TRINITY_DN209_c0_g3~~TRINITY_DN209_c0_g3_i9.p1  ORF type:complete len:211 (+),score=69.72 TRINITY_DN209_c0_g3_i9:71-703(+)